MDEKKIYRFKKKYENQYGSIVEGRTVTTLRGNVYMDGVLIPKPFDKELMEMIDDENFQREYIKVEQAIKNKV